MREYTEIAMSVIKFRIKELQDTIEFLERKDDNQTALVKSYYTRLNELENILSAIEEVKHEV